MKDYKNVHMPNHPNARYNGCVRKHVLIAEEMLGRPLNKGETVHHKDKNKDNNSKSNLMIFKTQADHSRFHKGYKELIRLEDHTYICTSLYSVHCSKCGSKKDKQSKLCSDCSKKERIKNIPAKNELEKLLWKIPTTHIAKKYGVTDKAVEKWCKRYNLAKPSRGYWMKLHAEVN